VISLRTTIRLRTVRTSTPPLPYPSQPVGLVRVRIPCMYPRLSSPAVLYPSFPISRRSLSIELPTCSIRRLSMGGLRNADASTKKGGKGCDDVLDTETGKTRASVASRRLFRERLGGFGQEVRTVIKPATFVVACDDGRCQSPSLLRRSLSKLHPLLFCEYECQLPQACESKSREHLGLFSLSGNRYRSPLARRAERQGM
jgi:hypothetical protein